MNTHRPLMYASISIPIAGIGVVSNKEGVFTFHIPSFYENEQIQISYLGYTTQTVEVNSIQADSSYYFEMQQISSTLDEVLVLGEKRASAARTVKKAIKKIRVNYPKNSFQLHGYYRDYIREVNTDTYKNLTEAAVIIEDHGFDSEDHVKSKIKLEQIRYNASFSVDSGLNLLYDGQTKYIPHARIGKSNELALLRLQDPIRNHYRPVFSFVKILDETFIPNHTFRYESVIENESGRVYVIAFGTHKTVDKRVKTEYWANGKIYINAEDLAILKFSYHVDCKLPSYFGDFFDFNLEYKKHMDHYFLNYISMSNYFEMKDSSFSAQKLGKPYFQHREFFTNKVQLKPYISIKKKEAIRRDKSLFENYIPVQEGFWEDYNYLRTVKND